jgi:hypothetical protein
MKIWKFIWEYVFSIIFFVCGVLSTLGLIGGVQTFITEADTLSDTFAYKFFGMIIVIGVSYILCGVTGYQAFIVRKKK